MSITVNRTEKKNIIQEEKQHYGLKNSLHKIFNDLREYIMHLELEILKLIFLLESVMRCIRIHCAVH